MTVITDKSLLPISLVTIVITAIVSLSFYLASLDSLSKANQRDITVINTQFQRHIDRQYLELRTMNANLHEIDRKLARIEALLESQSHQPVHKNPK